MPLWLLSLFDRWLGTCLLYILALPLRLVGLFLSAKQAVKPRHVFLKLKGGGSLMIALPALLGLRRQYPDAEFCLVCTQAAKYYAELTGVFDRYMVIDDSSFSRLLVTGLRALRDSFHCQWCVDLEPNSWLAAVFTMLTCARRRIGLVKPEQSARRAAYTSSLPFTAATPIYVSYDGIAALLGAAILPVAECRAVVKSLLPPPATPKSEVTRIALAPFASDLSLERMMPIQVWADLLKAAYENKALEVYIFGSARNRSMARVLIDAVQRFLPLANLRNLCGQYALPQTAAMLTLCDEVWAIDSGLLHTTRILGVPNRSFWGPTVPTHYLRPIADLQEKIHYHGFACSPCVQIGVTPPCGGHNLCMITMTQSNPDLSPAWVIKK